MNYPRLPATGRKRFSTIFVRKGKGDECPDGYEPDGVTFDKFGDLYGTTAYSGNINDLTGGTLFKLSPSDGQWTYRLLSTVPLNSPLSVPLGAVSFDSAGDLYGTFAATNGGVFRLDEKSKRFRFFAFNSEDGDEPLGGVYVDDRNHALYGTTLLGGTHGLGTIYDIDVTGHESVLYSFCSESNCTDGKEPWVTPTPDGHGNIMERQNLAAPMG